MARARLSDEERIITRLTNRITDALKAYFVLEWFADPTQPDSNYFDPPLVPADRCAVPWVAFGENRERLPTASSLQARAGVAPVMQPPLLKHRSQPTRAYRTVLVGLPSPASQSRTMP